MGGWDRGAGIRDLGADGGKSLRPGPSVRRTPILLVSERQAADKYIYSVHTRAATRALGLVFIGKNSRPRTKSRASQMERPERENTLLHRQQVSGSSVGSGVAGCVVAQCGLGDHTVH